MLQAHRSAHHQASKVLNLASSLEVLSVWMLVQLVASAHPRTNHPASQEVLVVPVVSKPALLVLASVVGMVPHRRSNPRASHRAVVQAVLKVLLLQLTPTEMVLSIKANSTTSSVSTRDVHRCHRTWTKISNSYCLFSRSKLGRRWWCIFIPIIILQLTIWLLNTSIAVFHRTLTNALSTIARKEFF